MKASFKRVRKDGLKTENLGKLQSFIEDLKKGSFPAFRDKTEQAERDLRKAKLL